MNDNQEYIKFWLNVKDKCSDIQKDYNNLSNSNKIQVDNVVNLILHTSSIGDIINILNSQIGH